MRGSKSANGSFPLEDENSALAFELHVFDALKNEVGKNDDRCPRGRVEKKNNKGNFKFDRGVIILERAESNLKSISIIIVTDLRISG